MALMAALLSILVYRFRFDGDWRQGYCAGARRYRTLIILSLAPYRD